jgi:hypothetical protein
MVVFPLGMRNWFVAEDQDKWSPRRCVSFLSFSQSCFTHTFHPGEHEAMTINSWIRAGNLRQWINRPDCPQLLQEFHWIFTKYFHTSLQDRAAPDKAVRLGERTHCNYSGTHYSRASTHVRNSLIMYILDGSGKAVAGSIEEINILESGPEFRV